MSKSLAISYIASPFFLVSPNRLLSQSCFAPLVKSIFDEFLWGEAQESADFSSRATQKGAEIDCREAYGVRAHLGYALRPKIDDSRLNLPSPIGGFSNFAFETPPLCFLVSVLFGLVKIFSVKKLGQGHSCALAKMLYGSHL